MRKPFNFHNFVIAFCIMALALVGIGCTQNQAANVSANREHAATWVNDTLPGYTLVGFTTATLDTDNDGYVSCDITVRKDGTTEMCLISLSCPTASTDLGQVQHGGGCKL